MEQSDVSDTMRLRQLYSRRVAEQGNAGDAHVSPEAILAVVRAEGTEEERLATLEHVMSCAACHRDYEWLTAVDQAGIEHEAGGAFRRPWWTRTTPLAAAASLLLVAGTVLVLKDRGRADVERGRIDDIVLVSPPADARVSGPLTFVWRSLAGASGYMLEVQRRDQTVAFTDTTSDTTLTIADPARVLPETEYRWWVRETTDGTEPRSSTLRSLRR